MRGGFSGSRGRIREASLSPHRIRGVSFRRQRSATKGTIGKNGGFFSAERPSQLDEASLAEARPPVMLRHDIHRLIYETSREELHALVIDCIDHVSHWRQLSHAFDNYISMRPFTPENEVNSSSSSPLREEPGRVTNDHFLATETHAIFALWRHRLEMLEWISQTQFSLSSSFKKHRR